MSDARVVGPDFCLGRAVLFIELVWRDGLLRFIQDLDLGKIARVLCLDRGSVAGGFHIFFDLGSVGQEGKS